eukprot:876206-Pyramimonas_sp.AAC.1
MEIYYMYTKLRRDFGRHPNLADEPAEVRVLADIRPDSHISDSFIDRNPVVTTVAVVPDMSEHEVGHRLLKRQRVRGEVFGREWYSNETESFNLLAFPTVVPWKLFTLFRCVPPTLFGRGKEWPCDATTFLGSSVIP